MVTSKSANLEERKKSHLFERDYTYLYLEETQSFIPQNKRDLRNIFYSILNQGWESYTFQCPTSYKKCLDDVSLISKDQTLLSNINNYVSPFNSYTTIKTLYDETGVVTVQISPLYTEKEIADINERVDEIMKKLELDDLETREKIKAIHDYIIEETKYDVEKVENKTSSYDSARIQGVLYDHYAICSGYTDTMAVFLDKLHIPNYKISSTSHVWNAVLLDNTWYHLDLTWDDPVTTSGKDMLSHDYFLITDQELKEKKESSLDHQFDYDVYLEFKN